MNVAVVVICQEIVLPDVCKEALLFGDPAGDDDEGYRLCEVFGGDNRIEKAKKFVEKYFSVSDLDWEVLEDPTANTLACNFVGTYPNSLNQVNVAVYIHDETVK